MAGKQLKKKSMSSYPDLRLLIGGDWTTTGKSQHVINPADESIIGAVPLASRPELEAAMEAAEAGFRVWRRVSPAERARIMYRAAQLVRERIDEIATAVTLELGKPLIQSRGEVLRACETIEWDAAEGQRLYGRIVPSELGIRRSVIREPVGVVAAFTPWNFPVGSPARKVSGALSAGCSVILKAAEETPAGAVLLTGAFVDAGLPPGVLNLVFGEPAEISEYLIAQSGVRLVTFTGSVGVGKQLAALAGRHMKPAIMELGGHAPVIICEDADPVAVAEKSVLAKSRTSGQVCVSPTRFLVHDAIYERFMQSFTEKAKEVNVGCGLDDGVQMGPLANHRRLEAIERLVADAIAKGARLMCGGARLGRRGFFYPLTVLADVPREAAAMREEPFGPLALISRFAHLHDAVAEANAVPFGLVAYAFTEDTRNSDFLSDQLECGNLAINHFSPAGAEIPFGGVKDSGYGREGGIEGLQHYTTVKTISRLYS
jgi:succinate-semialdehyde dehydrogenase/glutarate-semialdehyde dehydrogenase